MEKQYNILNKPKFTIYISTNELTLLQKKSFNIFLKKAEIELKSDIELLEIVKEIKPFLKIEKERDLNENEKIKYDKINKRFKKKLGSHSEFEIDLKKIIELAGLKEKNDKFINKELEKIHKISIKTKTKDKIDEWESMFLVPYVKRKGFDFEFRLAEEVKRGLVLGNSYVPLQLLEIRNLVKSKYSLIIYELMSLYSFRNKPIKFELNELRKLTGTKNEYKAFSDFEKRVLKVAVEEINEKTDLFINYEKLRKGRSIGFIEFSINKKDFLINEAMKLDKDKLIKLIKNTEDKILKEMYTNVLNGVEKEREEVILELDDIKMKKYSDKVEELYDFLPFEEQLDSRKSDLKRLLGEHSFDMIKADIEYCNRQDTKNYWGYLLKSINSGHYSAAEIEKAKKLKELKLKKEEIKRQKEQFEVIEKQQRKEEAGLMYEILEENDRLQYEEDFERQRKILERTGVDLKMFILMRLEERIREEG